MHGRHWSELSAIEAFGIARLRQQVFIVEQDCPYPDLDDKDLAETTTHWVIPGSTDATPRSVLRVLDGGDRWWLGRVVTDPAYRGDGLSSLLISSVLEYLDAQAPRPIEIAAQARLETWYGKFGFVRSGDNFLEDGISHVPMIRAEKTNL